MASKILDGQKVTPRAELKVVRDERLELPPAPATWRVIVGVALGLALLLVAIAACIVLGVAVAPIVGAAP